MPAETKSKPGLTILLAIAAGLALPVLYVLSWGPVGALVARWGLQCKPLETAYFPIIWIAHHCPGTWEPLQWYSERFDFLRPDPDARARQLINALDQMRNVPEIWEKAWSIDRPDLDTPFRTHGGLIEHEARNESTDFADFRRLRTAFDESNLRQAESSVDRIVVVETENFSSRRTDEDGKMRIARTRPIDFRREIFLSSVFLS